MGGFRAAPVYIVADGQSLNVVMSPATVAWPGLMCADLGYPTPYVPAIVGAPWLLLGTVAQMYRRTPYAHAGLTTIYVMLGGESDLDSLFGSATGATTYARMTAMADQCATAGYTYMIGCTIPPAASLTGGEETQRLAYNTLIVANGSGTFDAICDVANTPGLDDNTDETYYQTDHIHLNDVGQQLLADTIAATVLGLL